MAEKTNPLSRFQVEYHRSNPAVKIVVIVSIVFSILAVAAMTGARINVENRTEVLRQEAARLEHENQDLLERIDLLGSVQSVRQIAEEELGLVDPNAIIIETE